MSLVHHFDNQYSISGLLGFSTETKKSKQDLGGEIQSLFDYQRILFDNRIDIHDSMHTMKRQSSNFVKIEDNVLNFTFDRSKRSEMSSLGEAEIKLLGKELHRIHLKYLTEAEVQHRRKSKLSQLKNFAHQFENLKQKGLCLEKMLEVDKRVEKDFGELNPQQARFLKNYFLEKYKIAKGKIREEIFSQRRKVATNYAAAANFDEKQSILEK